MNGVEVHPPGQGVRNRQELDALVERAAEESPPVLPTIQELNDLNPKSADEFQKWMKDQRSEHGTNWKLPLPSTIHLWQRHWHSPNGPTFW